MSNKRDRHILRKLINHIDHTLEYCEGVDFDALVNNRMLQEACVFNVLPQCKIMGGCKPLG